MDVGLAYVKTTFVGEETGCTPVAGYHKKEDRHSEK
jgi:hypothetical protein